MAGVVIEMSAKDAQAIREYDKLVEKNKQLKEEIKDVRKASKQTTDEMQQGAQESSGKMAELAKSFAGVGGAIAGALAVLRQFNEERRKSIESAQRMEIGIKDLATVANSPAEMKAMLSEMNTAASRYGITRDQAAQIKFASVSEGFDFQSAAKASSLLDTEGVLRVAGQVPTMFGGAINTDQAIAGTLASARQSRLTFSEMATSMPIAAEGLSRTGATPAETMAALSAMASRFKSGQTAAERLKAFGNKVQGTELGGLSLMDAMSALEGDAGLRESILGGSQEAQAAFEFMLRDRSVIQDRTAATNQAFATAGTPQGMLGLVGRNLSPTNVPALMGLRGAEQATEAARENALANGMAEGMQRAEEIRARRIQSGMPVDYASNFVASATGSVAGPEAEMAAQAGGLNVFGAGQLMSALTGPYKLLTEGPQGVADYYNEQADIIAAGFRKGQNKSTMAAPDVDK